MRIGAYRARWQVDRDQGRMRLVSTRRAASHIRALLDAGATGGSIATAAGVHRRLVWSIVSGERDQMRRSNAVAILAVTHADVMAVEVGYVPRLGSVRRIQALQALGWTHADIQTAAGMRTSPIQVVRGSGTRVSAGTRDAIARAVSICHTCPIRERCPEVALANNERHGIWGGLTEGDRAEFLRRKANQRRADARARARAEAGS